MPIRLRLTLWYALLLLVTLLLSYAGLYVALQRALEQNFDQTLRVRAAQLERELLSSQAGEHDLRPGQTLQAELEPPTLDDFAESGVYVQLLSPEGELVGHAGTRLPINPDLVTRASQGREGIDSLPAAGRREVRMLYYPVTAGGRTIAIVQVAETLRTLRETLEAVQQLMLGSAVALLLAALGSGWFLTRRALAPVAQLTAAARHIAQTGSFTRRLTLGRRRDEVGDLADTFDLMISRIEEMLSRQRQFLADTSHELRNPLSIVLGNLDFLRRVTTDQPRLESIREADLEAHRMSRLVKDLLLLAQTDGASFLQRQPVRLDQLVREIGEQARGLSRDRPIELDTPTATWVEGDPDRLRQVVWNLLENALRYTPTGGLIRLAVSAQDEQAVLEVSDSGPGVPPESASRIFERFFRADPSRTRTTGGAGLGLAIVKHIAEAHGGQVVLQNRPGSGATFRVTLPQSAPAAAPLPAQLTGETQDQAPQIATRSGA